MKRAMSTSPYLPEGPNILMSEVRAAIRMMMRKNEAAGPDGVVIEMIDALEYYHWRGHTNITEVINKIYCDHPEDLNEQIHFHYIA